MKSKLQKLLLLLLLSGTALMAQNPAQLARHEEQISLRIFNAYLKGKETGSMLASLRRTQKTLRASVQDPLHANLLTYMDLCVVQLGKLLPTPPSPSTIAKVHDLTHSLAEGSRYIAANRQQTTLASR